MKSWILTSPVAVIASTYAVFFVTQRIYLFFHGYFHESGNLRDNEEVLQYCDSVKSIGNVMREKCEHLRAMGKYAAFEAGWNEMYKNTFFCGAVPCSDVFSPTVIIVLIALALIAYSLFGIRNVFQNNKAEQRIGQMRIDRFDQQPLIEEADIVE